MTSSTSSPNLRLRVQVEFYFSPSNLPKDQYLQKHMDKDNYVPISIIASFPKVMELAKTPEEIVSALETSIFVELNADKSMIRAKAVLRDTVVVRNLPNDFSLDALKATFESKPEILSQIVTVEKDSPNYLIVFKTEEAAQQALAFILTQQLDQQPASAFIKSAPTYHSPISASAAPFIPAALKQAAQQSAANIAQRQNTRLPNNVAPQFNNPNNNGKANRRRTPQQQQQQQPQAPQQPKRQKDVAIHVPHVGYTTPYTRYDRETLADIVNSLAKHEIAAPAQFIVEKDGRQVPTCPVVSEVPATHTTLLHPIPVMFPSSPSPEMAIKQPENLPPFLALGASPAAGVSHALAPNATNFATELPPLGSAFLGKSIVLTASAAAKPVAPVAVVNNGAVADKKKNVRKTSATGSSATSKTQNDKDGKDKKAGNANNTGAKKSNANNAAQRNGGNKNNNQAQQRNNGNKNNNNNRVNNDKKRAQDERAFPSLGKATVSTTTTTTLNFAATVAKEADPENVERVTQLVAQKKQAAATAAAAAALVQPEEASDAAKTPEDKQHAEKSPKAPKKAAKATDAKKKEGKKPAAADAKKKEPVAKKSEEEQPVVEVAAPAGSWAALAAKAKSEQAAAAAAAAPVAAPVATPAPVAQPEAATTTAVETVALAPAAAPATEAQ